MEFTTEQPNTKMPDYFLVEEEYSVGIDGDVDFDPIGEFPTISKAVDAVLLMAANDSRFWIYAMNRSSNASKGVCWFKGPKKSILTQYGWTVPLDQCIVFGLDSLA